ncbi:hypothetical protein DM860_004160 [Cuscuta australis]|uniref:Methyltransferase type 11 domain-containing protein n=1 Tax=Cuscuta australis TaxID=267555 RepID=A0A328CXS8_9ASTE|nr:hypothetical protein DM860_004160 [Cuscuta australis]
MFLLLFDIVYYGSCMRLFYSLKVGSKFTNLDFFCDMEEWDSYYQNKNLGSPPYDWYLSWKQIKPALVPVLEGLCKEIKKEDIRILVPGCGDSGLSKNLYDAGFTSITNVDYSTPLMHLMKKRYNLDGMQWITKDFVLSRLEDEPMLNPRSYNVVIDKGFFDTLAIHDCLKQKDYESCKNFFVKVKQLLVDGGKYICLRVADLEENDILLNRFWLGWKMDILKVCSLEDDVIAFMIVIDKCSTGLVHDIGASFDMKQLGKLYKIKAKALRAAIAKENKAHRAYMMRASSLGFHSDESCWEVDYTSTETQVSYRLVVLRNEKFQGPPTLDIIWVPEDELGFNMDALTAPSSLWLLQHFFPAVSSATHMIIVISPKLCLLCGNEVMNGLVTDLRPALTSISPEIVVNRLHMWENYFYRQLVDSKKVKGFGVLFLLIAVEMMEKELMSISTDSQKKKKKKNKKGEEKKSGASRETMGDEADDEAVGMNHGEEEEGKEEERELEDIVEEDEEEERVPVDISAGREGTEVPSNTASFPKFDDGDDIPYYSKEFTIKDWLANHKKTEDRWLDRYAKCDEIIPGWSCDRLKRESLRIIQSLIIAVIDFHKEHGCHGDLSDMDNFVIRQYVDDFAGSKVVRFRTRLIGGIKNVEDKMTMREDMTCVLKIFWEILEGKNISSEMSCLDKLLFEYPEPLEWKRHLLRNYPALWDGRERSDFFVKLYFQMVSSPERRRNLIWAPTTGKRQMKLRFASLTSSIPRGTIFEKCMDQNAEDPSKNENNLTMLKLVRYVRGVIHQFREKEGGSDLDVQYVEAALSTEIFEHLIIAIYTGMCMTDLYL